MEIDQPIAVRADTFADLVAIAVKLVDALAGVVDVASPEAGSIQTEGAIARSDHRAGTLLKRRAAAHAAGDIAFAVLARQAAQQDMHGQAQGLTLDIPQRQVERSEGVYLFPSRRVEERTIHVLPETFDELGILADQPSGTLLDRILRAAFSDSDQTGVGFHRHHHIALVEQGIEVGWGINPNPGDLHLGDRRLRRRG